MKERVFDGIVEKARQALLGDLKIAVFGWKDSNHDRFTRGISPKKVIFAGRIQGIGESVGLVMMTRFVGHEDLDMLRARNAGVHPVIMTTGQIKLVLQQCQNHLICHTSPTDSADVGHEPTSTPELGLNELAAQLSTQGEMEMSAIDAFCKAFAEKANAKGNDGHVGKVVLGELIRDHQIDLTVLQLGKKGFIIPVVSNGAKKAGRYKVGPEMEKVLVAERLEPTDPIDKARYLIANEVEFASELARREAELQAERDRIAAELRAIEESHAGPIDAVKSKLARVALAKELMQKLTEV